MAESKGAIVTAAFANLAIAGAKFVGYALTGSAAMISEGVHSVVDTANQGLLLLGLSRAEKAPDVQHPFGYGREVYFWSFVVALLIFLAGGFYSIYEGVEKILHPQAEGEVAILGFHLPGIAVNLAILIFAILVEGYSFVVAFRTLPKTTGSTLSTIRRSKDPSLFVVLVEDTAALAGLALALIGLTLAHLLDMPALDGVASIGIGIVLVAMAAFLMIETHGLLIGEAADPKVVAAIHEIARAEPGVRAVNEVLTQHLGPKDILANVSVDIEDAMSGGEAEALVARIDRALKAKAPSVKRVFIEIKAGAAPQPEVAGAAHGS